VRVKCELLRPTRTRSVMEISYLDPPRRRSCTGPRTRQLIAAPGDSSSTMSATRTAAISARWPERWGRHPASPVAAGRQCDAQPVAALPHARVVPVRVRGFRRHRTTSPRRRGRRCRQPYLIGAWRNWRHPACGHGQYPGGV